MTAECANDPLAFLDAAVLIPLPQHRLGARLMEQIDEDEFDRAVRLRSPLERFGATTSSRLVRPLQPRGRPAQSVDGPPSENLRELLHVLLRVAAIHAERVELEQLARVVFVESAALTVVALSSACAA